MFWHLLILTISFCFSPPAEKYTFSGKIVSVKDGDTFKILNKGKEETIRLLHIDSPEKNQPFGSKAKQHASALGFGRLAKVVVSGKDRYGRTLAEVYVDGRCINKTMVKDGMAWHFKKYSKSSEYARIEVAARNAKAGLWIDKNPMAPWEWRKMRRQNSKAKIPKTKKAPKKEAFNAR